MPKKNKPAEVEVTTEVEQVDALGLELAQTRSHAAGEAVRRLELELVITKQELEKRREEQDAIAKDVWEKYSLAPEDEIDLRTRAITRVK